MHRRRLSSNVKWLITVPVVLVLGLLIGFIDIHSAHCADAEDLCYLLLCAVLGYRWPRAFWLWPILFAFTLYGVHIWALRHGYTQPYVEKNEDHAVCCLFVAIPGWFGGCLGGGARLAVRFLGDQLNAWRAQQSR